MILYLLRHAKSSWADASLADHDRPLAPRGERAATRMGTYLAGREPLPGLALCSSARRAVQTLERVVAELPEPPAVRIERDLYMAGPEALLGQIREVEDAVPALLLVGHNPSIEELAAGLAGTGERGALKRLARKFPTAALAELHFGGGSWRSCSFGCGELRAFCTPKDLV